MDNDNPSRSDKLFGQSPTIELTGKIMVVAIVVLFLVVVFFLFLHLYAKWFWWRVEENAVSSGESRRQRRRRFVFAPGQDPALAALRRGLDAATLRSLPVLIFRTGEFKDGLECAVCLSEVVDGEKLRMLPKCNHGFHLDCIDMWFQSHSTCPLCRNPVASECSDSTSVELSTDVHVPSVEGSFAGGYSSESPNFPTNVLFWGDESQVSSGGASLEEGPSSSLGLGSSSQEGMLVIDIPTAENIPSVSLRSAEEEQKSPMPTRLRSLKRLLSKEKRVVSCSSASCVDVEQGGRNQSS